jgi:NTE family protein
MKVNLRNLRSHPLLSLIPAFAFKRLMSSSSVAEYPKGTVVFREGSACDAVYFIISGRCESHRSGSNGHDAVEEVFGPGDIFGERELLNHEAYRSTVSVVTDSVLLRIRGEDLRQLFVNKPSFAGRFSQTVGERWKLLQKHGASRRLRRIVSFMSLSPRVATEAWLQRLAATLHALGEPRLLVAHLLPSREAVGLSDWAILEGTVNGEFCFADQVRRNEEGYDELRLYVSGDPREPAYIAPLFSHFGLHYDYVILHLGYDIPSRTSIECTVQSDTTYVLIEPTTENRYDFRLLIRELCALGESACSHIKPIVCMDNGAPATEFSDFLKHLGTPAHSFVRGWPISGTSGLIDRPGNYPLHVNSLAREIGRCRIGLALSSGGARGLAHIGVIQVLEENGIEVDMIAGSSMGAYVGGVWACGYHGEAMEMIAREVEGRWGLLRLLDPVIPPRKGFLRPGRVLRRLRRSIGHLHFSQLVRPLRVVATHLSTLERAVFSSGEVAEAVGASIAIPGVCVPVELDGELYIDGGIADPLPADVLREAGINQIIAVNTIPTPERLRQCLDMQRELQQYNEPRRGLRRFLNEHLNYFARGNILDTLLRSLHGAQTQLAEASCRDADVVLRPWDCDSRWHDFTHPQKYIDLGRKVAEDQLTELRALVKRKADAKKEPLELSI